MDGNITLIHRIAALHVIYEMNRSQVLWFGELVALSPVEQALINLVPPLDKENPASSLTPWLNEVRLSQNAITSIIDLPSQCGLRVESRYPVASCLIGH